MGDVIPTLSIDTIFGYAGDIVTKLLPFVYVSAGISLGFTVVSRIVSAFR
jgi:hypothetical protein